MGPTFKEYRVAGEVLVRDGQWRSVLIQIGKRQQGVFNKPEIFLDGEWRRTEIVETPRGLEIILPVAEIEETIDTRFRVRQSREPKTKLRRLGISEADITLMENHFSKSELVFLAAYLTESESDEILAGRIKLTKLGLEKKIRG